MSSEIKNLLNGQFPAKDSQTLSTIGTSKAELQQWVSNLPMLNVGITAKQIFTALQELAVINLPDATRFELMEVLRPAISSMIESLSKHYRTQSILNDERAERIAVLAQQFRIYTAMIYHGIATRSAQQHQSHKYSVFEVVKKKAMINLIAKATHRGLAEFFYVLSKTKMLYLSDFPGVWLRAHELFNLASRLGLAPFALEDKHQNYGKKATIEQMYLRLIFLSASQTSKLRQAEIKTFSQLSELWVDLLRISPQPSPHDLLWVDTTIDAAASYAKTDADQHAGLLYINVDGLLSHVENLNDKGTKLLHADEETLLTPSLKRHLLQILHTPKERAAERQSHEGTLTTALGFIGSHYQVAGQRPFEALVEVPETDLNLDFADQYSNLNQNYELTHDAVRQNQMGDYHITHDCPIVNVSDTGYCLRWSGASPRTLRNGELISLKKDDDANWSVGLIRWVQQQLNADPEFGIELLSAHGIACGARVIQKDGSSSDYMRTLLLPHDAAQNKSTLVTPALVFKSGHKVLIRLGDEEVHIQLERPLLVTQSFSQFEFVVVSTTLSNHHTLNDLMI